MLVSVGSLTAMVPNRGEFPLAENEATSGGHEMSTVLMIHRSFKASRLPSGSHRPRGEWAGGGTSKMENGTKKVGNHGLTACRFDDGKGDKPDLFLGAHKIWLSEILALTSYKKHLFMYATESDSVDLIYLSWVCHVRPTLTAAANATRQNPVTIFNGQLSVWRLSGLRRENEYHLTVAHRLYGARHGEFVTENASSSDTVSIATRSRPASKTLAEKPDSFSIRDAGPASIRGRHGCLFW